VPFSKITDRTVAHSSDANLWKALRGVRDMQEKDQCWSIALNGLQSSTLVPIMGIIAPTLGILSNKSFNMYTVETPLSNLGNALFSKTQQRVLALLFGKPDQSFFTNEIIRWAGLGKGTVARELERMLCAGLVVQIPRGNQLHYQANQACPIFQELTAIVRKTFGIGDVIRTALSPLQEHISQGFIYGSIAKGDATASSDVDLMLIGKDLSYSQVMDLLAPVEAELGRTINPTLYSQQDFAGKMSEGNHFIQRVMEQTRIPLWNIGSKDR
jgi:predicted nucleotidyltransferase